VVDIGELLLDELERYVERNFRHVAEAKGLDFLIRMDTRLPKSVFTDAKRLQQIIKNLLSNAFKFTHSGQVTLTIEPVSGGWTSRNNELDRSGDVLALSVADTGIGISGDKQHIIFEAFQQADGSTSRKYGGTGLGLAISRELARLLQGEIRLSSNPGRGSTFTLYLPRVFAAARASRKALVADKIAVAGPAIETGNVTSERAAVAKLDIAADNEVPALSLPQPDPPVMVNEAGDDRDSIVAGDRVLLIVENDLAFSRFLLDTAREKGFKGLVTSLGASALALTREYKPTAITLDIVLPDIEGWRVLGRLKSDIGARHIPICVISTDEARERALSSGALRFIGKPIQSKDVLDGLLEHLKSYTSVPARNVLVVEHDPDRLRAIRETIDGAEDVRIASAADGEIALRMVREQRPDCIVLNPGMPGLDPAPLVDEVQSPDRAVPVLVFGEEHQARGDGAWQRLAKNPAVHWVHSYERLLDQSTLYLHCNTSKLPAAQRRMLGDMYESNKLLAGKRVLIVDDDVRNIFALSSVLEQHDMLIVSADNGRDAINMLGNETAVDVVLMDIMMPEMDGLDTTREIRRIAACKDLPIIAVTAKAMKGDRDRCLEAGAWDYLSKPVDTEQLLAVLRMWLQR